MVYFLLLLKSAQGLKYHTPLCVIEQIIVCRGGCHDRHFFVVLILPLAEDIHYKTSALFVIHS